jgi:hypothetical protein
MRLSSVKEVTATSRVQIRVEHFVHAMEPSLKIPKKLRTKKPGRVHPKKVMSHAALCSVLRSQKS